MLRSDGRAPRAARLAIAAALLIGGACAAQYCEATIGGPAGAAGNYACKTLPAACGDTPTCTCLASTPCGNCQMSTAGDLTTRCLLP